MGKQNCQGEAYNIEVKGQIDVPIKYETFALYSFQTEQWARHNIPSSVQDNIFLAVHKSHVS